MRNDRDVGREVRSCETDGRGKRERRRVIGFWFETRKKFSANPPETKLFKAYWFLCICSFFNLFKLTCLLLTVNVIYSLLMIVVIEVLYIHPIIQFSMRSIFCYCNRFSCLQPYCYVLPRNVESFKKGFCSITKWNIRTHISCVGLRINSIFESNV